MYDIKFSPSQFENSLMVSHHPTVDNQAIQSHEYLIENYNSRTELESIRGIADNQYSEYPNIITPD